MTRFARKVDANQPDIVKALRADQCFVQSLASVGNGCPDLLVYRCGLWQLLTVKNPNGKASAAHDQRAGYLTPDEKAWMESCPAPVLVVTSPEEAVALMRKVAPPRDIAEFARMVREPMADVVDANT